MRDFPIQFATAQQAPAKELRAVVAILFDTASFYCTSHDDITNVPGVVLQEVLKEPSAISQRLQLSEGRSEIGSFSFSLVDVDGQFTDEIRAKLADQAGLRRRKVQLWLGHAGFDFTAFELFQTQLIIDCDEADGIYTIQCNDITREARKDVFEPKTTTLRDSISATAETIPVYSTTGFETIVHGTSWSDAPGSTVFYAQIEKEKIRCSGKTADTFIVDGPTGRGVLNTKAVEHAVDAGTADERRTPITEYIYIELNGVALAYALLTGTILGTANVLPAHWHAGIDPALVVDEDFSGLGPDLYDASDASAGVVLLFEGLKKTDARRFLEKEVFTLLNCFPRVYADGTLGVKRLPAVVRDAASVATLTDDNICAVNVLKHRMSAMANVFVIDWNFDVARNAFTRRKVLIDADSITENGEAPHRKYEFRGLHGSRHSDATIATLIDANRDAYSYPPEEIDVELPGSLLHAELGDVVRVQTTKFRDYNGPGPNLDRAFMVTNQSYHWARDRIALSLFGSTLRPGATPPTAGGTAPLPDAFYTAAGTNLNTIAVITTNVMATGNYVITGNADATAAGAIYYHDADLTIPNGCNLMIAANVQLRIRGHLTLAGTINGVGGGHAGVTDPGTGLWDATFAGNPGFVGHSRGWDGIRSLGRVVRTPHHWAETIPAIMTSGQHDAFPRIEELRVSGGSLLGLPTDLRGTGGAPGGRLAGYRTDPGDPIPILDEGGPGAAGGAGLVIVCRGMSFGVSASIDLSGEDTSAPALTNYEDMEWYAGAGGAGGPGALLILLDGNALSVPDVTGKVIATTGTISQPEHYMRDRNVILTTIPFLTGGSPGNPYSGFADPDVISGRDHSNAAHRIQYIPEPLTPVSDVEGKPAAVTLLTVTPGTGFNTIRLVHGGLLPMDSFEVWTSLDNNRANSTLLATGRVNEYTQDLPVLTTRYAWARVRRDVADRPDVFSDWYPVSATGGISATTLNPGGWNPVITNGGAAQMIVTSSSIEKSGGSAGWDSAVHSVEAFGTGCALTFRAAQTSAHFMIGLNSDPTTDANYASLDHAWYRAADGHAYVYESGTNKLDAGTYDTSTTTGIVHDGPVIRYTKNGIVVYETAVGVKVFYLDSSFYTPGAKAVAVSFGPAASQAFENKIVQDPNFDSTSLWTIAGSTAFVAGQVGNAVKLWGIGTATANGRGASDMRVAGGEIVRWKALIRANGDTLENLGADIRIHVIHEEAGGANPQTEFQKIPASKLEFAIGTWTMVYGYVVIRPAVSGTGARYARLKIEGANAFGSSGTNFAEIELLDADLVREQSEPVIYTGSSRNFDWQDLHSLIQVDSTSAVVLTISSSSLLAFPIGSEIAVQQYNTGAVTITTDGSSALYTPVNVSGARNIEGRYATVGIKKIAPGIWVGVGRWAA